MEVILTSLLYQDFIRQKERSRIEDSGKSGNSDVLALDNLNVGLVGYPVIRDHHLRMKWGQLRTRPIFV